MKEFFDTSVFVAALLEDHANHSESFALLAAANKEHTACGLHSLAEVYATMTALPSKAAVAPEQALFVVQELRKRCTVIALNEEEYLTTLEGVAKRGLRSGAIYDALLLACAVKSNAEKIYTRNLKHFRSIAPDLADRIVTPS